MKKKIISLMLVGICGLLVGCDNKDNINININNVDNSNRNRFIGTGDKYYLDDTPFRVYYDSKTNIVYLGNCNYGGYSGTVALSVMYNSQGQPMTLEEYQASK